jgi:hypothetical protein
MSTKQEKDQQLARISNAFLSEFDIWKSVYSEIEEGWNFLAGEQYTEEQKTYYRKKKRPTNVFNNYLPIFTQTIGMYLQTQSNLNVHPTRSGDPYAAARLEDVLNHFERDEDTIDELARAMIAGMVRIGWVGCDWSNEREIDGSMVVENIDEFDVMFDSRARHPRLRDAKYMMRSRWLDEDDILRLWPGKRTELETVLRDKKDEGWIEEFEESERRDILSPEFNFRGQLRALEFHEFMWEEARVATDKRTGESEIFQLSGKREQLYLQQNPNIEIIEVPAKVKKITECIPGLHFHLDSRNADVQDGRFDYIPYSAFALGRNTIDNFGLHRAIVGPQKQLNDMENVSLDIYNKQANVGNTLKPGAISNYREYKSYGREPGFDLEIEDNFPISDAVKERKPPTLPSAGLTMADRYKDWMHTTSNARANFMGDSETANENATLFNSRVKEAEKSGIFSIRGYQQMRRELARKQLAIVQQNLTLEKYFLITSSINDNQQEIMHNMGIGQQVLDTMKTGEYDVVVDNKATNPTERRLRFLEKRELLEKLIIPAFGAAGVPWRNLLEDADLGDIDDWIEQIEGLLAGQTEESEEEKAFQITDKVLELAGKKQALEYESGGGFPSRPAAKQGTRADSHNGPQRVR